MRKIVVLIFAVFCLSKIYSDLTWPNSPAPLSTSGVDATEPQVAMDASGNVVAAWIESGIVKSKNMPAGMSWGAVSDVSGAGASSLNLVVDSSGNATAIWVSGGIVQTASQTFGGMWGSVTSLTTMGTSSTPKLAVDAHKDVVAIWVNNGVVESATLLFNGSWPLSPTPVGGTSAVAPRIAIQNNATVAANATQVVAVWHDTNGSVFSVFSATQSVGAVSWGVPVVVSSSSENSVYPRVAVDINGNAIAIWYNYTFSNLTYQDVYLFASFLTKGGNWNTPSTVSDRGVVNPANLDASVSFANSGVALAIWANSLHGSNFTISSSYYVPFLTLTPWQPFGSIIAEDLYAVSFKPYFNPIGVTIVLFSSFNPSDSSIQIQSEFVDFGVPFAINWHLQGYITSGNSNGNPHLAGTIFNNTLTATAVYENYDGMNTLIYALNGSAPILQPPVLVMPAVTQNSNDFGFYTDWYNTIQWMPSPSQGVMGYVIFRDGETFIGNTPNNVYQWIDHNQVQNGSVVYYIAAFDSEYILSPFLRVSFP